MKQKMSDNKYIVENATKETLEEKINEIITKYNYKKMIYGTDLGLDLNKIQAEEKFALIRKLKIYDMKFFIAIFL